MRIPHPPQTGDFTIDRWQEWLVEVSRYFAIGKFSEASDFTDEDATPDVSNGNFFRTANTNPTTITGFDNGTDGQIIFVVINDANTTIDFTGTTLVGNKGVDWIPSSGDHLLAIYDKGNTKWRCIVSSNTLRSSARAYLNNSEGNQSISAGVEAKVQLDAENWDLRSEFDSTTNYRFTATEAGLYDVKASIKFAVTADENRCRAAIKVNGTTVALNQIIAGNDTNLSVVVADTVSLTAGQYVELYGTNADSDDEFVYSSVDTYMSVTKL